MGAGASAGLAAGVRAASPAELQAVVAGLSPSTRERLGKALGGPPPLRLCDVQADASKSCVARVQEALDAITARDGELNCCCEVLSESALKRAAEADARLEGGACRRPLEGVPFLVKVNIDLAGTLSTASMPGLAEWRPESTAPVVAKLMEAGAIPVAKTNMPEAALGCWGYSPVHGITKNAVNPLYTCAGSSSGTASGIAAGYTVCGLGSDTGGSVRMPAECCGIAGLRPSRGRYSSQGVVPCDAARDTVGPMAATVADLAALDAVATGEPLADYKPASLAGLGIAVPGDLLGAACPGHRKALGLAMAALSKAGAKCKTEGMDFKPFAEFKHQKQLEFRETGFDEYLASHPSCKLTTEEVLDKSFYSIIKQSFKVELEKDAINWRSSMEQADAVKEAHDAELLEWEAKYEKYFADNGVDFILTPCTHGAPPTMSSEEEHRDQAATFKKFFGQLVRGPSSPLQYYRLNSLRIPSLAMPTAARHEGLMGMPMPAGILLYGKPNEDKMLIQVAMALEELLK